MSKRTVIAPEAKLEKKADLIQEMENHEDIHGKVAAHKRALQNYESKKQFLYPVEKITEDHLFIRNVKYPGANEDFPCEQHALFRFVSKYYPNAKGGPIYVDEPRNTVEADRAWQRHDKMRERNLR